MSDESYIERERLRKRAWRMANPEKQKHCTNRWRAANRPKVNAYQRRYSEKKRASAPPKPPKPKPDPNVVKAAKRDYKRVWKASNRPKVVQYKRDSIRRAAENLTDGYIRSRLVHRSLVKRADIPPELIAVKRAHLKVKRQLKNAPK